MARWATDAGVAWLLLAVASIASPAAQAQSWQLIAQAPPGPVSLCLLLTDASVMCQSGPQWYRLSPSASGSYAAGGWSALARFPPGYEPDAFASAVLADGRVVVVGGEYLAGNFALANAGALYDPRTDHWSMLQRPPATGSPDHWACIGDAPATLLADGRLLVGSKLYQDAAVFDPKGLAWTLLATTGKRDSLNSEEGWTLLPDGSVLTLDVHNAPLAERLLIAPGASIAQWISAGTTPSDLHTPTDVSGTLSAPGCPPYAPPGEVGPLLLRPDGSVFAVGATGATALYAPPSAGSVATGAWIAGPSLPAGYQVADGPAALLPNGHVLFGASPGASGAGLRYFEFDGSKLVAMPAPANGAADATYFTSLLVLPSGQVLFTDGTRLVDLYTPAASPSYAAGWAPTIANVAATLTRGASYAASGTQFNGLGQASAYGDESQNATNYPLVRLTNVASGHVAYARTHDHSTMAVATGPATVSTTFDVPGGVELGPARLEVVANGIPSAAVDVTIVDPSAPPPPSGGSGSGGGGAFDAGTLAVLGVVAWLRMRRLRLFAARRAVVQRDPEQAGPRPSI